MGYIVESSIKLHKCSNYSKIRNFIFNQSHKKNCEFVYENFELEGRAYSEQKNYCIIIEKVCGDVGYNWGENGDKYIFRMKNQ